MRAPDRLTGEAHRPGCRSLHRAGRAARCTTLRLAAAVLCLSLGVGATLGCAVTQDDLQRWETTLEGPKRLRAVVLNDKYPHELRVQAALSLIRMKPRKGQRIGIKLLVEKTLAKLSPEARGRIVADLVPLMMQELMRAAPVAQPGQPLPPDPSFKFKDAAYEMLTYDRASEGTTIITDPELKKRLVETLTAWAMADFERRLNDRAQMYGMEQLLRFIGAPSVVGLPALMSKNAKSLTQMADIVAKLGDAATKEQAGRRLVEVADYIASTQWRQDRRAELEEANRRAQIEPTAEQFEKQLEQYQEESLVRVFSSMQQVGGHAVLDYALRIGADKALPAKRRQAALAALEGRIPRDEPAYVDQVVAIAASDAPDVVLDQAFRRIRELPRDRVIGKLYGLLSTDQWKVRRSAGATALQMSTAKDIEEFLSELGRRAQKNLALGEVLTYGAFIGDLKEGNPRETVDRYLERGALPARLVAISYYFTFGTSQDVARLKPLEDDREKIPACDEGAECSWECEVAKEDNPKERETKQIETVGAFVRYCIVPQMETNKAKNDKEGKKKEQGS